METLFLVGKIVLGVYFILAGIPHFTKAKGLIEYSKYKKVPMPEVGVYVGGLILVLGGIGILFQMDLVWAYGALAALLVVFAVMIHNFWATTDEKQKMTDMIMFQKNIAIAAALLMLLAK
ncbi:MAG: DoxX family protein [Patescibacteria group bacterium]